MKTNKRILTVAAGTLCVLAAAAGSPAISFTSNDSALCATFAWARDMAMSYVRDSGDPVGPWYEAALPGRESFCIRDLSHQAVAGHLLGLDAHNRNMTAGIASHISESKDWCSWWETDRTGRPTECDYVSDKEFWYNLPANFDLTRTCLDLYEWTADTAYLRGAEYAEFYRRSFSDYLDRWQLRPDGIMSRPPIMNTVKGRKFHTSRGLPSYAEGFGGITVGIDLIGAALTGHQAYARICALNGDSALADSALAAADAYRELIDNTWWDAGYGRYNTYYKEDGSFHRGEGLPYMLLTGALGRRDRVAAAVGDVLSREWNVENLSAFPFFLYRLGYGDMAREIMISLPAMKRSDYPEVSFGVIDGVFRGLMGIEASASHGSVATCHRSADPEATAAAANVPVAGGTVSVSHRGHSSSTLTNNTGADIVWQASFAGRHDSLRCKGKKLPAAVSTDPSGTCVSTIAVTVAPGHTVTVTAEK